MQARKDSVSKELEKTDRELQKNKYNIRSSAILKQSNLETQKAFLKTVYLEIAKNLEASKISLLKSEPFIKIWDAPKDLLKKQQDQKNCSNYWFFVRVNTISFIFSDKKIFKRY